MLFFTGVAVVLLTVTAEARIANSSEPSSFCTETKECLLYDQVCQGNGYEVRHYKAFKVVSANEESYVMEVAVIRALRKLYRYISGENHAGVKIDRTMPFMVKVKDDFSFWNASVYVVSLILPSAYQSSAPKPTDSTVFLTDLPDMKVYVKSYGGWMVSVTSMAQSFKLKDLLDSVWASYHREYHYNTAYDSLFKLTNRHNEVWYVVHGEPVCAESV